MKIRPGIELANLTDVGCERSQNEDNYCYAEPENDDEMQRRGRLAGVAGGTGGQEGGQGGGRGGESWRPRPQSPPWVPFFKMPQRMVPPLRSRRHSSRPTKRFR